MFIEGEKYIELAAKDGIEISAMFKFEISGEWRKSAWGAWGADPDESPEIEIISVENIETGELLKESDFRESDVDRIKESILEELRETQEMEDENYGV